MSTSSWRSAPLYSIDILCHCCLYSVNGFTTQGILLYMRLAFASPASCYWGDFQRSRWELGTHLPLTCNRSWAALTITPHPFIIYVYYSNVLPPPPRMCWVLYKHLLKKQPLPQRTCRLGYKQMKPRAEGKMGHAREASSAWY